MLNRTNLRRWVTGTGLAALITVAAASGASASTHPQILDPAGDAKDSLGINHADIDILSTDVSTVGANLVIAIRVANLGIVDVSSSRIYGQDISWGGSGGTAQTSYAGYATFGDGDSQGAIGTSVFDHSTSTVTMTFAIADINAGFGNPFGIGTITYLGHTFTRLDAPFAPLSPAYDSTTNYMTTYVVGS